MRVNFGIKLFSANNRIKVFDQSVDISLVQSSRLFFYHILFFSLFHHSVIDGNTR